MKTSLFGMLLISCAVAAQTQPNPLLGTWKLKTGGDGCNTSMVFTPKQQRMTWHGSTSPAPVGGYTIRPHSVTVRGKAGVIDDFTWTVVDGDTITQMAAEGLCVWKRQ